jgi:hypothetical protein
MAGYEAPVTVFTLKFEDHPGLEVKARSVAFGKLLSLADDLEAIKGNVNDFGMIKNLVDTFVKSLKSWNVMRDGEPVTCDRNGFDSLEFGFAMEILEAWSDAIGGGVSIPLGRTSNDGSQSEVPPIAMETL